MGARVVVVYRGNKVAEVEPRPLPAVADEYCPDKDAVAVESSDGQFIDCGCWRCRTGCGDDPDCVKKRCLDTGICYWEKHR